VRLVVKPTFRRDLRQGDRRGFQEPSRHEISPAQHQARAMRAQRITLSTGG
jgi:hypothetical protein